MNGVATGCVVSDDLSMIVAGVNTSQFATTLMNEEKWRPRNEKVDAMVVAARQCFGRSTGPLIRVDLMTSDSGGALELELDQFAEGDLVKVCTKWQRLGATDKAGDWPN